MRRPLLAVTLALGVLTPAALFMAAQFGTAQPVSAAKNKSPIDCPKKIGGLKSKASTVGFEVVGAVSSVHCFYSRGRDRHGTDGDVRIRVSWRGDFPGERATCVSRDAQWRELNGPEEFNRGIRSAERQTEAAYWVTNGKHVKRKQGEAAALKLLAAAEPLAHPCIPNDDQTAASDGFKCPLVVGDTFVRVDWYGDDPPVVVDAQFEDPAVDLYTFECTYAHAYQEEGSLSYLRIGWTEGDPENGTFRYTCRENHRDDGIFTTTSSGTYPFQVFINNDLADVGGQAVADRLVATAAAMTGLCPGATAPDGLGTTVPVPGPAVDADTELSVAQREFLEAAAASDARLQEVNRLREASLGEEDRSKSEELILESTRQRVDDLDRYANDLAGRSFPASVQPAVDALIETSRRARDRFREVLATPPDSAEEAEAIAVSLDAEAEARAAEVEVSVALGLVTPDGDESEVAGPADGDPSAPE